MFTLYLSASLPLTSLESEPCDLIPINSSLSPQTKINQLEIQIVQFESQQSINFQSQ